MTSTFKLGKYLVSESACPIFISEIGAFFGKDMNLAFKMISEISKISKKNSMQPLLLKSEILHDKEICLKDSLRETYISKSGIKKSESYRNIVERRVIPLEKYKKIFDFCKNNSLGLIVSVYDEKGVKFAVKNNAVALKIASFNIINYPLINYCAKQKTPIILDTGRSTLSEVAKAIELIKSYGEKRIIIEHSPDGHPAHPRNHNLRILETYKNTFQLHTGLSDHYIGNEMLYMSIALRAKILEKGIYTNSNMLEHDISFTASISELDAILKNINSCWLAMGEPLRDLSQKIYGNKGTSQRHCIVAKYNLKPGDNISKSNVYFAFPSKGISVEYFDLISKWKLKKKKQKGEPIQWDDIK